MASGDASMPLHNLAHVRHVVIVMSGKGGVGKSTVASQLAVSLQKQFHKRVGILDIDLCGPSIAKLFGVEKSSVVQSPLGWMPIKILNNSADEQASELLLMSIAFLIPDPEQAVIWRGPKKQSMIKTFVDDVYWADEQHPLDYLIIDTPPGTSDEHISIAEALTKARNNNHDQQNTLGAVLVTTPQMLAVNDVRRQITFCRKAGLKILGLVENMCGYVCPHCDECTNIFSRGGGEQLAKHANISFLGRVPISASIAERCDTGQVGTDSVSYLPSESILQIATKVMNATDGG